jgi:sensor histidine kinase regulating citrate/malate metabolism
MEQQNNYVHKLKHNIKNQLLAFYDILDTPEIDLLKNKVAETFEELKNLDNCIFSNNPSINSLLKIKSAKAFSEGVPVNANIDVPSHLCIDIGDLGIFYGNILDNAIEASQKVAIEERYIEISIKYLTGAIISIVRNSKENIPCNTGFSTKKSNKWKHGIGIDSIRNIASKYNGTVQFNDQGDSFEVKAILYEIKVDTYSNK